MFNGIKLVALLETILLVKEFIKETLIKGYFPNPKEV